MTTKKAPVKKSSTKPSPSPAVQREQTLFEMVKQQGVNLDRLAEIVGKLTSTVYSGQAGPAVASAPMRSSSEECKRVGSVRMGDAYLCGQLSESEQLLEKLVDQLAPVLSEQSPATASANSAAMPSSLCEYADRFITHGNRAARMSGIISDLLDRLEV